MKAILFSLGIAVVGLSFASYEASIHPDHPTPLTQAEKIRQARISVLEARQDAIQDELDELDPQQPQTRSFDGDGFSYE
jgi:hypothetical protein